MKTTKDSNATLTARVRNSRINFLGTGPPSEVDVIALTYIGWVRHKRLGIEFEKLKEGEDYIRARITYVQAREYASSCVVHNQRGNGFVKESIGMWPRTRYY